MARTSLVPKGIRKSIEFAGEVFEFLTDESRQRSALERAAITPQAILHEILTSVMETGKFIRPGGAFKPNGKKKRNPAGEFGRDPDSPALRQ